MLLQCTSGHHDCPVYIIACIACRTHAGSGCSSVSQQLWLLLLQLQADDSSAALASQAAAVSDRLAAACALSSSADLAAMHAHALINDVTQVPIPNDSFKRINARVMPCFFAIWHKTF